MILLFCLAVPIYAAAPLGGLDVVGTAWTNQVALPDGASVFPGDVVETDREALAVLESPEASRIEVRQNSKAAFSTESVELIRGAVGSSRLTVHGSDFEAVPDSSDAWFVVSERNGEQLVAVHRGSVVVRQNGLAPLTVPAGSFALAAALPPGADKSAAKEEDDDCEDDDDPNKASKDEDDDERCKGAILLPGGSKGARRTGRQAGADANSKWTLGSLSHKASVGLLTAAGAGVTAGVVVAAQGSNPVPVSPAN